METKKIFGPPGTGKTTFLLNTVEQLLNDGIPPERIGYFAFTRKAAHEAKERALKKFPHLNAKSFTNFRTIHSLSFVCLGIRSEQVLKDSHIREFSQEIGIQLKFSQGDESWEVSVDHPAFAVMHLARQKMVDLEVAYNASELQMTWFEFRFLHDSYRQFLLKNHLYDFTDMLEMFSNAFDDAYPSFDAVIIDEAQDLTPLQWKIAKRLIDKTNISYVAGDDDQAIFGWSGADVTSLLTLPGENVVLDQSYRVPQAIHDLSAEIIQRVRYRVDKEWKPMDTEGAIHKIFNVRSIDFENTEGSWMILASTNYMLNEVHEHLKSTGILFERNHVRSIGEGTVDSVYAWERLRKGDSISAKEVKNIYNLLGPGMVRRGFKKFDGPDTQLYSFEELSTNHGLDIAKETPWYEALVRIPQPQEVYIRAALRRGQSLRGEPRIRLSTIHGAKGGEADNVALHMDLSSKFMDLYHQKPDDIHRLFYVAVTRAKKNLYLVLPKDYSKAFHI